MGERLVVSIEKIQDAEGILIDSGNVVPDGKSKYEEWVQGIAQKTSGDIVALRVNFRDTTPAHFLWIDGEILPGEELNRRSAKPWESPLPDRVVIARTGTIFGPIEKEDSVISSRPKPQR